MHTRDRLLLADIKGDPRETPAPGVWEVGGVTARRPLLLVDAPNLYFRAFFGVPEESARAPDGSPVNAVRGFVDMLASLIVRRRPDRLVCAFDVDWRPAWRVALLPSYKTHRLASPVGDEIIPDPLSPQVPVILDVLAAVGIAAAGADGYEADDVLGTLAASEPGPVEVVSGDRDLFQLVDDDKPVRLLYCARGVANLEVCTDAQVRARFGVPAAAYADFAALRGDPSDGLPGVRGIGAKTAAQLIRQHGDLQGIRQALDDPAAFTPRLRAALNASEDYLAVAPTVVGIARDVSLPDLATGLPAAPVDPGRLLHLAEQWNLAASCRRLIDAIRASA